MGTYYVHGPLRGVGDAVTCAPLIPASQGCLIHACWPKFPVPEQGRIPWLWSHLGLSPEPHSGLQVESRDRRQWLCLSVAETPPAFAGDTSSQASDPSRHLLQRPGLSPPSLGRESLHAPALPRHSTLGGRWCPAAYFQGALDSSWFGRRETAVSFRPKCPHGPRGWGHLQP